MRKTYTRMCGSLAILKDGDEAAIWHGLARDAATSGQRPSAMRGIYPIIADMCGINSDTRQAKQIHSIKYRDGKLTVECEEPETKGQELARKLRERASLTADEEWLATLREAADLLDKQ